MAHYIDSLHRFLLIKKVFIAENNAVPCSGSVQWFSIGGQIFDSTEKWTI